MCSIAYGGLDVHKDRISACLIHSGTGEMFTDQVPNEQVEVVRAVKQWSKLGELRLCYEAGACGYVLYRWLEKVGIDCEVIAPSLIPRAPGDRVKTDRRDARQLARLYAAGLLKAVRKPSEEEEAVRAVVRLREQLTTDVVRQKNRVVKYLRAQGVVYRGGKAWTKRYWAWVRGVELPEKGRYIVDTLLEELEKQQALQARVGGRIEEIAKTEPYAGMVERLKCLRGIGTITAMVVVSEAGDMQRFGHAGQLMSYFGLVPREHSSGSQRKTGGITKSGSARVRGVMIEAGWHQRWPTDKVPKRLKKQWESQSKEVVAIAQKARERLNRTFRRIAVRRNPQIAVTAVAREMTGFVWAILRA